MIERDDPDVSGIDDRTLTGGFTRHDLVLVAIPGALLAALLAGRLLPVPPHHALAAASAVAAAAIADGLFRNPPGTGPAA